MKFVESHTVKYSEGNPKREYALIKAFHYTMKLFLFTIQNTH